MQQELSGKSVKEQFKEGSDKAAEAAKPPMTKEETMAYYEDALPMMKAQDEHDEYVFRFNERKVRNLELQVRELEAIGYLSQWKSGQDEAKKRQENEEKMKAEWDAMTSEQQEEWKQKAQANIKNLEEQTKQGAQKP